MPEITAPERDLIAQAMQVLERQLRYGPVLDSPSAVREYLALRFAGLDHEEFHVLFLDGQNRLIEAQAVFRGTLTQTAVYPREIVKTALLQSAVAVVLAHNHPSQCVEPSEADKQLTRTLQLALALIGVRVLDHIIVGASRSYSFAEKGLI